MPTPFKAPLAVATVPAEFSDNGLAPAPEVSWLAYRCDLILMEEDRIAVNVPLAGKVTTGTGGGADALGKVDALRTNVNGPTPTVQSDTPNIVQRVSGPVTRARLVGKAMRLAYPIAPPVLVKLGGQPVVQARRTVMAGSAGSVGGLAVFTLLWDIEYVLAGTPATLPLPADVTNNMNGNGGG